MADDSFVGKEVTVVFDVTDKIAHKGVVLTDDEKGIVLRRDYRRGRRDELIPRDQIRGVVHEIEKGPRHNKLGAKGSTAAEPEETEDFDNDGLDDDEPDNTEWDDE